SDCSVPWRSPAAAPRSICERAVFFFSSRRRHTRWPRDWSSDVCSSDLIEKVRSPPGGGRPESTRAHHQEPPRATNGMRGHWRSRSEERRVGKECRSRRSPYQKKKKKRKNTDIVTEET